MKTKSLLMSLVVLALSPSAIHAQEVVGSAMVSGRQVQLLSDKTWRFADATAAGGCLIVKANVSFCGQDIGWVRTRGDSSNSDVSGIFRLNDRNYGTFVVEGLGSSDGLNAKMMRTAVISNAAKGSGVDPKDIVTWGVEKSVLDGSPAEDLAYSMNSEGLSFVFINTVLIRPHQTVQVITYAVGESLTDDMKQIHRRFVEATHVK